MNVMMEQCDLGCNIEFMKIDDFCESAFDMYCVEAKENSGDDKAKKNLIERIATAIKERVVAIRDFIMKLTKTVIDKARDTFNSLIKGKDFSKNKETVKMESSDGDLEALNAYIGEMVKLERRVLNLRTAIHQTSNAGRANLMMDELRKIDDEIDALNRKYEGIIERNRKIVDLALKDAIRFNTKQLNNVKLDVNAIQNKSEKVLAQFATDVNGCEHPKQMNIIQKMSAAIGTMTRKICKRYTNSVVKGNNILIALIGPMVGAAAGYVATKHVNNIAGHIANNVKIVNDAQNASDSFDKELADQVTDALPPDKRAALGEQIAKLGKDEK